MHGFKIVYIYLKFVLAKTDIRYLVCDVGEAALAHDPLLLVHLVQLLRHRLVQALLVAVLLGPRLHHGGPPPHLPHNRGEESELRVCVRHDAPAPLHTCDNISTLRRCGGGTTYRDE